METNTNMTLYHKKYNPTTKLDIWEKHLIDAVMWQGGKGAGINKGYEKANDIAIWIPYNKNKLLNFNNFSIGDIVVKGNGPSINKQSDLTIDSFNITTLVNNDYGSKNIQHIQIGAK